MSEDPRTPDTPTPDAAPKPEPKKKGPEPQDAADHPLVHSITAALPDAVLQASLLVGELTVEIGRVTAEQVCRHLKEKEDFDYLVDIFAVDYLNWKKWEGPRFSVTYLLYSHPKNQRIRLRTFLADGETVPTVSSVWRAANWPEREVWDMHGIAFDGHPNLERILTWEGFNGHPLRKDFPVEGIDTGAAIYPDQYPEGGGPPAKNPYKKVVS